MDNMQHQCAIFRRSAKWPYLIHRPRQRHNSIAAHSAIGGTDTCHAASRAGAKYRTKRFRAYREADHAGSCGRCRPGRGASRPFCWIPRVAGLATEPTLSTRHRPHGKLGHQHRARVVQAINNRRIVGGHLVHKRLCTPRGANSLGVEQIFHTVGDAVQGTAIVAPCDLRIGTRGLLKAVLFRDRDDVEKLG